MFEGLTGKLVVPGDWQYAQAKQEGSKAIFSFSRSIEIPYYG